jgi:hypothetical protein
MRWGIAVVLGLAIAVSAWGLAGAVESKSPLSSATPPQGAAVVKDTAAKPADPAAERKAREEAVRKAQELARTRSTLAAAKAGVNFENSAIKDVLTYLAEVGKFSIVYDNALQEAGIDLASRTITLRFTGMTFEDALNLILPKECGYRIEAGYVLVTTLEKSWIPLKTATYSIQLALAEVPDFEGPRFDVNSVLAQSRQGGGGSGLFGTTTATKTDETGKATPERIIAMIKKFVKNQTDRRIAPWDDEGGPATLQYIGGRLVVSQTEHGHRAVAKLLASIE